MCTLVVNELQIISALVTSAIIPFSKADLVSFDRVAEAMAAEISLVVAEGSISGCCDCADCSALLPSVIIKPSAN